MSTDTPTILVSIPDCTATHVLGSASIPLTSGTLSLIKYTPVVTPAEHPVDGIKASHGKGADHSAHSERSMPVFTLQIDKLAFPLMKETMFGTDATSPRVYLFVPELGPVGQASQGGHIRLELPSQAEEAMSEGKGSPQDAFEQALIGEGLLKEGWEAIRDEIERGVKSTVDGLKGKVSGGHDTGSGHAPSETTDKV